MAEKEEKKQEQDLGPQSAEEYVKALRSLQENSVDKGEYDKVVEERNTLIKAMAAGDTAHDQSVENEQKPDIKELRDKYGLAALEQQTRWEYEAMKKASDPETFGYNEDEIVSSDIVGMTYGSLFDATQTMVTAIGDGLYEVQVVSWYDNENSYTSQMVRTIKYFEKFVK